MNLCGYESTDGDPAHGVKPALLLMGLAIVAMLGFGLAGHGPMRRPLMSLVKLAAAAENVVLPRGDVIRADAVAVPMPGFATNLVGRWVAKDGTRIIVTQSGAIWSDRGHMLAELERPAAAGINFAFGNETTTCAYDVVSSAENVADWRLTAGSDQAHCPSGTFERPFSF